MISAKQAAAELAARRLARKDLLAFCEYTHPCWASSPHHRKICDQLARVERGEISRLAIFAPPRHTKSEIVSRRFPAFYMGRHPKNQIICASHTAQLAEDMSRDVMNITRDPYYRNLFPEFHLDPDAQAAKRWCTTELGTVFATGVGGAVAGRGAHVLIIDDPVKNREAAESIRARNKTWAWYTGDILDRLMPGGSIILMMTRWHEDDLAGRAIGLDHNEFASLPELATVGEWTVLTLKAITTDADGTEHALFNHPDWWPLKELHQKKRELVDAGRLREWLAKYQQNPRPEEGTYFKRSWWNDRYTEVPPVLHAYISSDYATKEPKEGEDRDSTEHGVFGIAPDSTLYVLDWWGDQTEADEWVASQIRLVRQHQPMACFGEAGTIGNTVSPLMVKMQREAGVFWRQEWVPSPQDKPTRARIFQAYSKMGRVRFPPDDHAPWVSRVIEQLVGFPGATHDDCVDVCAQMCRVIDIAHPAIVPSVDKKRPRDSWAQISNGRKSWKTQ